MAEYICREAILDDLKKEIEAGSVALDEDLWINKGIKIAIRDIKDIKAADVQPVKRGKWNTHDVVKVLCSGETLDGFCQCTACGDVFPLHYSEYNYCPNCGARMDGD